MNGSMMEAAHLETIAIQGDSENVHVNGTSAKRPTSPSVEDETDNDTDEFDEGNKSLVSRTVVVANLPRIVTTATLKSLFYLCGQIEKAWIRRKDDYCWGFITFADVLSVERAMSFDRSVYMTHVLEIKWMSCTYFTLTVDNIPKEMTNGELRAFFLQHGNVVAAYASGGFGIIVVNSENTMRKIRNGAFYLDGNLLDIRIQKPLHLQSAAEEKNCQALYFPLLIQDIPSYDAPNLENIFALFDENHSIWLNTESPEFDGMTSGIVYFTSAVARDKALKFGRCFPDSWRISLFGKIPPTKYPLFCGTNNNGNENSLTINQKQIEAFLVYEKCKKRMQAEEIAKARIANDQKNRLRVMRDLISSLTAMTNGCSKNRYYDCVKEDRITLDMIENPRKISSGTFGTVYCGNTASRGRIAYKKFHRTLGKEEDREIKNLLRHSHHQNIVEYHGPLFDESKDVKLVGYVMEYMEDGTVHDALHNNDMAIEPDKRYSWLCQVSRGLNYLHGRNVIHRDLKPLNLLLKDSYSTLRIGDFGCSRICSNSEPMTGGWIGTVYYTAPEIRCADGNSGCFYETSADVYSFGITMYEILTREKAFNHLMSTFEKVEFRLDCSPIRKPRLRFLTQIMSSIFGKGSNESEESKRYVKEESARIRKEKLLLFKNLELRLREEQLRAMQKEQDTLKELLLKAERQHLKVTKTGEKFCTVCLKEFDFTKTNRPMIGYCGHSICSSCCLIVNGKCPICNDLSFQDPRTNFALLEQTETNQKAALEKEASNSNSLFLNGSSLLKQKTSKDNPFGQPMNSPRKREKRLASIHAGEFTEIAVLPDVGKAVIKKFIPSIDMEKRREIVCLMQNFSHFNIVRFVRAIPEQEMPIGYVLEFMSNGSLLNALFTDTVSIDEGQKYSWCCQLSSGLSFLHSKGIVHGDVNPSNVLLSQSYQNLKLCFYGGTHRKKENVKYAAPEYYLQEDLEPHSSADVYSYAICVAEILTRRPAFYDAQKPNLSFLVDDDYWKELQERIAKNGFRPHLPEIIDKSLVSFLTSAWDPTPANRVEAAKAVHFFEKKWQEFMRRK